jgi:hypothetical protein
MAGVGLAVVGLVADIGGGAGSTAGARDRGGTGDGGDRSGGPAGDGESGPRGGTPGHLAQDTEGGHLHLYVDRKLQQMPYSNEATVTVEAGRHELTVEYVDARHVSYNPPIDDTVVVTAS